MALVQRLDLRQTQQLVMTPQLQQAIKLLQFNNMELADYVDGELESNPLLQNGEGQTDAEKPDNQNDGGQQGSEGDLAGEPEPAEVVGSDVAMRSGTDSSAGNEAPLDVDLGENVFNNDSGSDITAVPGAGQLGLSGPRMGRGGSFDDGDRLEQRMAGQPTLRDHINEQLKFRPLDSRQRMIAGYLTDLLDEAGYIVEGLEEVAGRLGCPPEDVSEVLETLQGLEPTGVFARDLQECLALQLKERDRLDPCMQALLENLPLLANRDFAALKRVCHADAEDLAGMLEEIKELNPKPGYSYSGGEPVQPIVPDVFVRKNPAGVWVVELNSETLPRVLVNNQYYAEVSTKVGSKKDKAYLSECLSNANWLVKALNQRARTILKVASEIVRQQEAFFNHGVRQLKPLNLRTIAEAISMHESTVSRVTSNKYIGTSRGIFEMKFFFTSAISSSYGGNAHSAEAVKDRISELIEKEDPKAVLSDDRIVTVLVLQGIDIARRTVAKYREAMKIPSSVQRRREKNNRL